MHQSNIFSAYAYVVIQDDFAVNMLSPLEQFKVAIVPGKVVYCCKTCQDDAFNTQGILQLYTDNNVCQQVHVRVLFFLL